MVTGAPSLGNSAKEHTSTEHFDPGVPKAVNPLTESTIENVDTTQHVRTVQEHLNLADKIAIYLELESFGGVFLGV